MTSRQTTVRWWHAFGTRIIVLVGVVAVLSGGSVGLMATKTSRDVVRQQTLTTNLATARAVAAFTSHLINEAEEAMTAFAERPSVINAADTGDVTELTRELLALKSDSNLLDSVGVADASGVLIASSSPRNPRVGASLADRDYFKQVMVSGAPVLGVPVKSRATGQPVAAFGVPISPDGRIRGVLSGGISLDAISSIITGIHTSPGARTLLVDRRGGSGGTIIADPDPAKILTAGPSNRAIERLVRGEEGTAATSDASHRQNLAAFVQVPGLPWGILIQQPSEEAFADLSMLDRNLALVVALLALGAAAVGIGVAARLTRPVTRLKQTVDAFSGGDLSLRAGFKRKDEIGQLAGAFDTLANDLDARNTQLRSILTDLEDKVAERTEEVTASNQALARQKATLDAVIGSMSDGLLVFDDTGNVQYWNRRGLELLGLEPANPSPTSLTELFDLLSDSLADPVSLRASWQQAFEHPAESALFEFALTTPNVRDLQVQVFPVASTTNARAWRGFVIRDVTTSRQLQRAKDELVATVSHELRTPLASLVGFTELLLDEREPSREDRRLYLSTMRSDGQRLTELIDNFLDLQRLEAGHLTVRLGVLNLGEVLRRQIPEFDDGKHPIVIDLPADLPEVWADERAVRGIVGNLLSNACKYSAPGSEIRFAGRQVDQGVEVSVQDAGDGIPSDLLLNLFEKFSRADSSDRRTTQGAGLGLAITKHLVEAMGGRIWAESAGAGHGSRFAFTLSPARTPVGAGNGTHGGGR